MWTREREWSRRLSIRATRADPPGRAASDPHRRGIYTAALQQFDELLNAAEVAGPAGRPLPLFYALSQAGRAIVAAYGESAEVTSHGLGEDRSVGGTDLLSRAIKRVPAKSGTDGFGAVAAAIGSQTFSGSASLGAIWAATPGAHATLFREPWESAWCPPLMAAGHLMGANGGTVGLSVFSTGSKLPREMAPEELLGPRYPRVPSSAQVDPDSGYGGPLVGKGRESLTSLTWQATGTGAEELARALQPVTVPLIFNEECLLPAVNEQGESLEPLITWWALMFGLSVFARYHPALWVRSLNLNESDLAVSLQALLDIAADAIIELVEEAISRPERAPRRFHRRSGPTSRRLSDEERRELDELRAQRESREGPEAFFG